MENLIKKLVEVFKLKNSPEITEIDIDGAYPLPNGIKKDFLKHCNKGMHALDAYFTIAKKTNGNYTFEGAIAYHEQNKVLYLNQEIPASHIHGGIAAKMGLEEKFSWDSNGGNYSELASNIEKYVLSENPEKSENGYDSILIKLLNEKGMHARPSAVFVTEAAKYQSNVYVRNGKDVPLADIEIGGKKYIDGKSIMSLMTFGAEKGSYLEILARGEDSKEAIKGLAALVNSKFGED